jgi:hypothetical protein
VLDRVAKDGERRAGAGPRLQIGESENFLIFDFRFQIFD